MIKNPNTSLWTHYEENAISRGNLVVQILSKHMNLESAQIMDVGCGTGGISLALARAGARVKAIDPDPVKIAQAIQITNLYDSIEIMQGELANEPGSYYDAIILNDVLEHVKNPHQTLRQCGETLKKDGLLYISTPNKWSLLNIFCDPHYSLPFVALLSRKNVKRIITNYLKWHSKQKKDFPQLLSFTQLKNLIDNNQFEWSLINTTTVLLALKEPEFLWSRRLHLNIIKKIKRFKLEKFFIKFINDRHGIFNKFINPTWYILAKRV